MAQAQAAGLGLYDVVVKIDPHCTMPIAARQLIQNAISGIGQVLVVRPDAKSPAATKQVEFVFATSQSEEQIAAKSRIPTIAADVDSDVDRAASRRKAPRRYDACSRCTRQRWRSPARQVACRQPNLLRQPSSPIQPLCRDSDSGAGTRRRRLIMENILRVEAGRIDNVLNLVGELIIGKSMLQQALNEFGKRYPKELLRGKFADAMAFQSRVLNDLQRSVMKIRMVPVDQLFRRFPRIVRDVARQCGREVDLGTQRTGDRSRQRHSRRHRRTADSSGAKRGQSRH